MNRKPETLSSSEWNFLHQLFGSPLSVNDLQEKTGLGRTWLYHIYNELNKLGYVTKTLMRGTKGYPITLFSLTEKGKEKVTLEKAHAQISYIVDLGSEGEVLVSLHSPLIEDKYHYEAYWLTHAPSITPILKVLDFENPVDEIDVHFKVKVPKVSKDVRDAAYFFTYLDEDAYLIQDLFWSENKEWFESSVAKGQGTWNTPYKNVGEACNLIMKSPPHIFEGMMLGLKSAEKKISQQVFVRGDIYNLEFIPLNIFEYLTVILPFIRKRERVKTIDDNYLGLHLFYHFIKNREVKEWIKRCLERDGKNWLTHIPFENFGFKRNKREVQSSWAVDFNLYPGSSIGLGIFLSSEKERWEKIGAIMHILLDTTMMKKYPSRLGDDLNYEYYTDDLILKAWERMREFWIKAKNDPRLKRQISLLYKKEYLSSCFFDIQKTLRDSCFNFLDVVYEEWRKISEKRRIAGTRELWSYLSGKLSPLNKLLDKQYVLPPDKLTEYKRTIDIINDNTKVILSGKKQLVILGAQERQKFITEEEWDPAKEVNEFLQKVDYEDFMSRVKELAQEFSRLKN